MVVGNVEHRGLFPFSPHTFWGIAWRKKCFGNEILQKKVCFILGFHSVPHLILRCCLDGESRHGVRKCGAPRPFPFLPIHFLRYSLEERMFNNKFLQKKGCLFWVLDSITCPCSLLLLLLKTDLVVGNVEYWGLFNFSLPEFCSPHTFLRYSLEEKNLCQLIFSKKFVWTGVAFYSLLMMLQLKVL